jgi:hypothetical protein
MKNMVIAGMMIMAMVLQTEWTEAWAGNKAVVQVSATVLPQTSQTTLKQPAGLMVTRQDVAKGYVDVEAGTVLQVTSNDQNGYYLNFSVDGEIIRTSDVEINGRSISVSSGVGLVHQPFPGRAGAMIQISYRLFISPTVQPGLYPWPVAVAAGQM